MIMSKLPVTYASNEINPDGQKHEHPNSDDESCYPCHVWHPAADLRCRALRETLSSNPRRRPAGSENSNIRLSLQTWPFECPVLEFLRQSDRTRGADRHLFQVPSLPRSSGQKYKNWCHSLEQTTAHALPNLVTHISMLSRKRQSIQSISHFYLFTKSTSFQFLCKISSDQILLVHSVLQG